MGAALATGVRRWTRLLAVAAFVLSLAPIGRGGEPPRVVRASARDEEPAHVRAVGVVGVTVADAARSTAFYRGVLGFEAVSDVEVAGPEYDRLWGLRGTRARVVRLRLGGEELELTEFVAPKGRPFPAGARSDDRSFQHVAIVVADMDAAYARVRPHVDAISIGGPQTLPASNAAAAGIAAFYFRDPDGHALELIHFPPSKGDPRWQEARGRLFLGIDHTAIGVRDTGASLAFYRDLLGLAVVGESVNVGAEQEHLTGVPGARVRITGLRARTAWRRGGTTDRVDAAAGAPSIRSAAPGVELLEYLAPRDGRDPPVDAAANDLVHWHATVAVADVGAAVRALRAAGHRVLSDVVALPDATLGFTRVAVVRDPDGHVLELVDCKPIAPAIGRSPQPAGRRGI